MQTTETVVGTTVAYDRRGTGQPMILLHGGMAPREYWDPVAPQFDEYAAFRTWIPTDPNAWESGNWYGA